MTAKVIRTGQPPEVPDPPDPHDGRVYALMGLATMPSRQGLNQLALSPTGEPRAKRKRP